MRKYVHWLKINGLVCHSKEIAEQFASIEQYLTKYPKSKAVIYLYNSGSFNWIVKLECEQNYRDLDMSVNCSWTYLERLNSKPKNIDRGKEFVFPEQYRKYLISTNERKDM